MAARKKAPSRSRKPAIALSLEKSAKVIDQAVTREKKARPGFKALGGIGAVLVAIREFCKNWPKVKPVLKKAIEFLKKNGQHQVAAVLEALVGFLDSVAKVCKIIPT